MCLMINSDEHNAYIELYECNQQKYKIFLKTGSYTL